MALLYVKFSRLFSTFPYDVLGQVWYLIVRVPDLCLLSNFVFLQQMKRHGNYSYSHPDM